MVNDKLAIYGGKPVRERPFPVYNTIGQEEKDAVMAVLDSGVLSRYLGKWGPEFYGGEQVRILEREWSEFFGVANSVSMNSATSCLYSAVGALGIRPGDEVIVTPYSMVASVTAAAVYGATPVFADIDPKTFCLTPETIEGCITDKTRAVIVVDLFGYPIDIPAIRKVTGNIPIIEDAAQAPGAMRNRKYAGTLADIGVFSLNYHKTIHCGEGGVAVTNDDGLATRLQLIRNHGEVVVGCMGGVNDDIIGYNYRLTEIEAAIACQQLIKLPRLVAKRRMVANYLREGLEEIPCLELPDDIVSGGVSIDHGFYVYPMLLKNGVDRDWFVKALRCEGIPVAAGYVRPIYREPLYSKCHAVCPVVEGVEKRIITTNVCHAGIKSRDVDDVITAFYKVVKAM